MSYSRIKEGGLFSNLGIEPSHCFSNFFQENEEIFEVADYSMISR